MISPLSIIFGLFLIIIIFILILICLNLEPSNKISRNIHHYSYYNNDEKCIIYHESNPFYKELKSVYMSETMKKEIINTIGDFIKHQNKPRSLRIIISGKEGIGKTTLIEALATHFEYSIIHFPQNNYTEEMIFNFFKSVNKTINNIIVFDNIVFESMLKYNKELYIILSQLIIRNDNNNIFIFTFTDLELIPYSFDTNFHIHYHYRMDTNINYVMKLISDNINKYTDQTDNEITFKYDTIKNKFLRLNHKITPGYIIPYLVFNEDFEKSLERFLKITNN